ncbi:MAG: ATP-binding cassette domain-containing protein [Spirochaetes bacterium]|nr:ATP-binding cassette domain-containing protein [Spirochaetota bacterium]NLJ04819.1 ATP-binding cassette domain-containing protein [Exilispira sp.]HOV45447.1 ATP-binding cassette domain-containing protein [Exilispira sp.]
MIEVRDVSKWYGNFQALKDISFSINEGEIVGFLGPNGAGKTTAMRIITGYFLPNTGTISINGISMEENPAEAKKLLGYLPEIPPLYPEMPVNEYLKFVAELNGVPRSNIKQRLDFVIEKTSLQEKYYSKIKTLSKGLKQRVGIAAAVIHDPKVIVLDEPTIGLDPLQIIEIRNLIKDIAEEKTIILSSHILAEVEEVCSRVIIINNGEIIAEDSTENLRKRLQPDRLFLIKINEENDISTIVEKINGVISCTSENPKEYIIRTNDIPSIQAVITKSIVENGFSLLEVKEIELSLEEIFAKLIKGE